MKTSRGNFATFRPAPCDVVRARSSTFKDFGDVFMLVEAVEDCETDFAIDEVASAADKY